MKTFEVGENGTVWECDGSFKRMLIPGMNLSYLHGFLAGVEVEEINEWEGAEVRSLRKAINGYIAEEEKREARYYQETGA